MKSINWGELPFAYMKTNYNVRCYYRDGAWGEVEVCSSEYLNIHMSATCLHYGQEVFEGLKAYRGKDGKVRIFRAEDNARRLIDSASYVQMQHPPVELFMEMLRKVVRLNAEFVPPYETGATLYIRPLLLGTGAQIGVSPAKEYLLLFFVTPVGPYCKTGFQPTSVIVERDSDRAAPLGTGHIKCGGNYAASLTAGTKAKEQGYSTCLYLDAREKKYIDECGPANFFGIKDNTYITPASHSILPSITNRSIMQIAKDLGIVVEQRPVLLEELSTFSEVGECGTAAVITPIGKIYDPDESKTYDYGAEPGPVSTLLYNTLRAIQYGDLEDKHGWVEILEGC